MRRKIGSLVHLLVLACALAPFASAADVGAPARYAVNGVAFTCPPEYRPVAAEGMEQTAAFFYDEQLRALLFVAAPDAAANEANLTRDLQRAAAAAVAGAAAKPFTWKRMFSPPSYNRYDRRRGEYWGYNGSLLLCFETHKLVFPSRTVHVGYAYLVSEGQQAKKDMRMGLGSLTDTVTIESSRRIARAITRAETGGTGEPPPKPASRRARAR